MVEPHTDRLQRLVRAASLLGALNESKKVGDITYSLPRMLTWQGVEPAYIKNAEHVAIRASRANLSNSYLQSMKAIFRKGVEKGVEAVEREMRELIYNTFRSARELGFQAIGRTVALDKFDITTLKNATDEELRFAKRFLGDMRAGRGKMPYDQRFAQYGNTVSHQFNMSAYQATPHAVLIYWEMTSAEPCPDCPVLAAHSPYTGDLGNNPLPTVPQAGETRCAGACKCYLRYEYQPFHIGTEPHMSYEIDTFKGVPADLVWLKSRQGKQVQRDLNTLFRREAHHRQMMDAYGYGTDGWKEHRALRDKWGDELKDYTNKYDIRAVPRANVRDFLAPVDDLLEHSFTVIAGLSEYRGDAAILRGLGITLGEASRITKNAVRMKLADGRSRILSHGDEAGASLWVEQKNLP